MVLVYVKPDLVSLKGHPDYNEFWVRDRILEDPSILGLGDLEVRDAERRQPKAGRLDLLLQDPETERRYEIEIMLGSTDASHIIRTLEYWDIERKRYPDYEHCAVIVAEDITSRFLNVISLFNSAIPIIAVQLKAIRIGNNLTLYFTKVLDEIERGEEDDDVAGPLVDRTYWEGRTSKLTLGIADESVKIFNEIESGFSLDYKKNYLGIKKNGIAMSFVRFKPKKEFIRVEAQVNDRSSWIENLENAEIIVLPGGPKRKRLHFRLKKHDLEANRDLVKRLFAASWEREQKTEEGGE
jgi:hypothetical protein